MLRDDHYRLMREIDQPRECRRVNGIPPTGHPRLWRGGE